MHASESTPPALGCQTAKAHPAYLKLGQYNLVISKGPTLNIQRGLTVFAKFQQLKPALRDQSHHMQSPPVTPKRKRRGSSGDADQSTFVSASAQKRAKATPHTPSKSTLAKAEVRKKKEWKADWGEYIQSSFWEKDDNYRQKFDTFEIHRSDAMKFYRLKAAEMDTLPHWEFENKNYPSHPGRSYSHEGVLMLVSRKHAMLAGLHEGGLREHELLKQGKKLFDEEQERLLQRTPKKNREPRLWKISTRRRQRDLMGFPDDTPSGSWESPIWEDGKIIGHWLNYQFDPNLGPEDDWMFSTARFRPLGSSEWVEPP